MPTVGENIKRLREAAGYKTQKAFAKALDVEQPRLSDWENDRYGVPEVANLLKIAKALRVTIDELLNGFDADYDDLKVTNQVQGVPIRNKNAGSVTQNSTGDRKVELGKGLDSQSGHRGPHDSDLVSPSELSLVAFLARLSPDNFAILQDALVRSGVVRNKNAHRSLPSARPQRSGSRKRPA